MPYEIEKATPENCLLINNLMDQGYKIVPSDTTERMYSLESQGSKSDNCSCRFISIIVMVPDTT